MVDGLVGRQTGTALGIWGTATTPPANPTPPSSGTGCRVSTDAAAGVVGLAGAVPAVGPQRSRVLGRSCRRQVRQPDVQRGAQLPAVEGPRRRRRRGPSDRDVARHLGHGLDAGAERRWRRLVHAADRGARRRPPGARGHRERQPGRRRPARPRRNTLDLFADEHVRARRPQRRAHARPTAIWRRHDAGWRLPTRIDDRAGRPDVPVLRQRREPWRSRHVAPGQAGRLLGRHPEHRRLQHARHTVGGELPEPRRVPDQLPGGVFACRADRRQHGPEPVRRQRRRSRRSPPRSSCTGTPTTPAATPARRPAACR